MLNRDDRVVYVGQKYAKELSGKIGFVVARVGGQRGHWVVDFPEHSYVMSETFLDKYRPTAKDENIIEIQPRRRRKHDEDEE